MNYGYCMTMFDTPIEMKGTGRVWRTTRPYKKSKNIGYFCERRRDYLQ